MDINNVYSRGGDDVENTGIESNISAVFENGTIFLTGATGFLGKMFLEKLLRSCPKLKRIYLLMRPKKGKNVEERLETIFDGPAFLHVSTAFSHCVWSEIHEKCYEGGMAADKLLDLVEAIDEDRLTKMTPGLLGEWPNTYVFTKGIAENLVAQEFETMPIAILRPAIVIASVDEPVKGWVDNLYGPTGGMIGAALGLLRSIQGKQENITELVPADYVINAGFAVIWDIVANRKNCQNGLLITPEETKHTEEPIFNVVSSTEAPITWKKFYYMTRKHAIHVPSELQLWYDFFAFREGRLHHLIACFFLHTVPAYLVDFICLCIRRKPMLVQGYQKINKFMEVVSYFALREWKFFDNNAQNLWRRMNPEDKRQYPFNMKNFDWDTYMHYYVRGARVYLLKDPLETIPKGRVKFWKLFIAHYTLIAILLLIFFKILCLLCSCIF
ncbi:fatty acyl-CoA reductase wat-like isoform X2 [Harmonia axyridis]|uniref:fatty acyl-CoA reductase wat-like isoform X2 n=1 Tax=Harmonia axyridis TaxID=115357 RepID=UPI001E275F3E|nr:fatty acyl-CoA reductase wat-like isoform X2 [Harmonia axyridis]